MKKSLDETRQAPKLSTRSKCVFGVVVVVLFFAGLELTFRVLERVYPPTHVDYGLGFTPESQVFVEVAGNPGTMITNPRKRVSFPRQTFKNPKPPGNFRIVVLGGSSVNYLQPELRRLSSRLSKDFKTDFEKVEVINCGGFAYGSHRLVLVFREILEYSPDLVLVYSGHNEFEEVEQLQLSNVQRLEFDKLVSSSAIVRFIRDRKSEFELNRLEKEHNQRVLRQQEPVSEENFARAWTYAFQKEDIEKRRDSYAHNLRLIANLAKAQQIPLIIGTVSSNLARPYLPQDAASRYGDVYQLWEEGKKEEGLSVAKQILVETVGRHQSSDMENEVIKTLASELDIPLVDVETEIAKAEPHGIPGETLFDDHCHLNKAGRKVWITAYEPLVRAAITESLDDKASPTSTD